MQYFFFFNDTATTEIYTLSLHDALPIWDGPGTPEGAVRVHQHLGQQPDHPAAVAVRGLVVLRQQASAQAGGHHGVHRPDRKSTRLNSSHLVISYAVFCLKKTHYNVAHTY